MAKTFKNLPRPGEPDAPTKPTSELDFFDLTDKPTRPVATAKPTVNTSNTDNTSNTRNIGNTSSPEAAKSTIADSEGDARQTFVLGRHYLEQLRDFVHARRAKGDYTYSQKQALQEALDLLFANDIPAAPRPAHAREREQQRRLRIQQGRRPATGE